MGAYSVPGVVRVDRDCSISKHGFRSGGGDDDLFVCEEYKRRNLYGLRYPPDPSIGYAKEVRTPNSNFSLTS